MSVISHGQSYLVDRHLVMRLIDQIIGSPPVEIATDRLGKEHHLAGVGAKAQLIRECPLRYVLDPLTSIQCFSLVRADTGLFDPGNELLRLPATSFWLEWYCEASQGVAAATKMGALVEAEPSGRRGTVTGYWQNGRGQADLTIAYAEFDLERDFDPDEIPGALRLRHGTLIHLNPFLRHVRFQLDVSWASYLSIQEAGGHKLAIQRLAEAGWFNLPMVMAFSAMLNSDNLLAQRASDLSRLNAARSRRGKPVFLEHIEVRLNLGNVSVDDRQGSSGVRTPSRLHHVRGHLVHRSNKTFWRSPHLRGDANRPIATKTITVKSSQAGDRLLPM